MSLLVDTNVLSELARPSPDPGVTEWARRVSSVRLSVVTIEEVLFGLAWHPSSRVARWFDDFVQQHATVVPITESIARRAGWMRGLLQGQGHPRTQADMLIAGTAQVHGLTLVTRNERDFRGCQIPVLNPFAA